MTVAEVVNSLWGMQPQTKTPVQTLLRRPFRVPERTGKLVGGTGGRFVGREQGTVRDWERVTAVQARREGIVGFIIERTAAAAILPSLVRTLCALKVPVVVFDPAAPSDPPALTAAEAGTRGRVAVVHYNLDRVVGRDIARYCLAMGHRHIAYFHATGDERYSRDRLAGMRAELADSATDVSITTVSSSNPPWTRPQIRDNLTAAQRNIVGTLLSKAPP